MMYLLDTNIIVDHLRKKSSINIEWILSGCAISIITLAELYYGAHKSTHPKKNLQSISLLENEIGIEILTLDAEIVRIFGNIKAQLEKTGEKLDEFDLLIASSALSHDYVLITKNKKHFERIRNLRLLIPA